MTDLNTNKIQFSELPIGQLGLVFDTLVDDVYLIERKTYDAPIKAISVGRSYADFNGTYTPGVIYHSLSVISHVVDVTRTMFEDVGTLVLLSSSVNVIPVRVDPVSRRVIAITAPKKDTIMSVLFSELRDDVKQFIDAGVIHKSDRTIILPKVVDEVTQYLDSCYVQGRQFGTIHASFDLTKIEGVDINQRVRAMLNVLKTAKAQQSDTISVSRPALVDLLETARDSVQKLRAIRYLDVVSDTNIPEEIKKQYEELRESILSLELRILSMNCQELLLK